MNTRTSVFEKHPKTAVAIIFFIVIFATDATIANLYRIFMGYNFFERGTKEIMALEQSYRVESDIYHHDLKKNVYFEKAVWGGKFYTVATDSLGFKSAEVKNTPKQSEKHRIIFMGDSFTEGIGIEYRDTFVGQIESKLSNRSLDILNGAASSYSPIIYWRKTKYLLEEVGLRFDEMVVFVDISDIQDESEYYDLSPTEAVVDSEEREQMLEKQARERANQSFLKGNSILLHYIYDSIANSLTSKQKKRFAINLHRSMWTMDEKVFEAYGADGLKKARHYMDKLYDLSHEYAFELTIAVYPWPDQIFNSELNSKQSIYWKEWAREKGIDFLDYFPCFIQESCDQRCRRKILEELFIEGDVHWNKNGHKLIAERFVSFFDEHNMNCAGP